MAANIVLLDRVLAHYGPETAEARATLKTAAGAFLERQWSGDMNAVPVAKGDEVFEQVEALMPKSDMQSALKAQAVSMMLDVSRTRWLMYEQRTAGVSMPLLIMLIAWLTLIFISFGLFAPRNLTVVGSFFVSALSVSGAMLLILEMYTPFSGLIRLSDAPIRAAIVALGR
jgi:hypothetical protein